MLGFAIADDTIALSPFERADAPLLMAIDSDPDAARWFDFPRATLDDDAHRGHAEEVIRRWATEASAGLRYPFAIRRAGVAIGTVELRPLDAATGAMSYSLVASERGRGYAARAVRLLGDAAIERAAFTRLEISTDVDNVASQRVAERAGFVRERIARGTGRFHHYAPYAGTRRDEIVFARVAEADRLRSGA